MPTDSYAPLRSQSSDGGRPAGPVKALLLGLAIDVGGSLLVGFVIGMVYAASLARAGMSLQRIEAAMNALPPTSWVFIVGTVLHLCVRVGRHQICDAGVRE
jgi:hypothetical protein